MNEAVKKNIEEAVKQFPILLFVKGSKEMPMCGFSKGVMDMFNMLGANYQTIDVLSDPEVREGIKDFTDWPTIPQVFINGEFVGGFDICRDLYEQGELKKMVDSATVTEK